MRKFIAVALLCGGLGLTGLAAGIYVRAPISVALWFTDTYPDFFRKTYADWGRDVSLPERLFVRGVAYKLSRDWLTYEAKRVRATGESSPSGIIGLTVANLKEMVLSQREVRHKAIDLPTYSRLLYGMAWCDGQNNLLAMLLAEFFDGVEHFNLWDVKKQLSPHTLVRINRPDGVLFSDMWSDIPVFALDEIPQSSGPQIPTHAELIRVVPPGSPEWAVGDAMERDGYENGRVAIRIKPMPLEVGALDIMSELGLDDVVALEGSYWRTYLRARILHLYGRRDEARKLYGRVLALGCGNARSERVICLAAERFFQNISENRAMAVLD